MSNKELYHHGVKGMKWGVRKLQSAKSAADSSASALREGSKIAETASGRKNPSKSVRKELSSMSDQELRARINRMNMEQQYANLNPSRVSRGASTAKSILDVAGSVAAIGASALGIAIAIKNMKE